MPQKSRRPLSPLGPPFDVNLGPLTRAMLSGAKWRGQDAFPAWQTWADDVETVLEFLDLRNRLPTFLDMIQKTRSAQHRDALLAEARGSFHLHRHGFRVLGAVGRGHLARRSAGQLGFISGCVRGGEATELARGVFAADDRGSEEALFGGEGCSHRSHEAAAVLAKRV